MNATYEGNAFPPPTVVPSALGTIWGFRYKDGKLAEHGTLLQQTRNIASFAQDQAGELYVLAFDGRVYSLSTTQP